MISLSIIYLAMKQVLGFS
ncbi:hypothetical protein ACFFIF_01035 [Vagococcus entomophilus]